MAAPDISLELFQILDAIDRRGSFAAAAEELGKVASALSYSIQKHEQALGVSLFVRAGRRSVFTPVGRLLLERGRAILGATASLADERSEEHTSELQSRENLVCRLLLEKKNKD